MPETDFQSESERYANQYEQMARDKRTSSISVALEVSKNRIDLIKDYTVFATALLGAFIAIATAGKVIIACPLLFSLGALFSFLVLPFCFLSRQYYIDEVDEVMLSIEKDFANITTKSLKIRYAKDIEERKRVLKDHKDESPYSFTKPWFFTQDIKYIGYLLFASVILLVFSILPRLYG